MTKTIAELFQQLAVLEANCFDLTVDEGVWLSVVTRKLNEKAKKNGLALRICTKEEYHD